MVVLNRIYTRTGDKGETALGDGTRVAKDSLRVEAYGTVDETNATVGLARLHAPEGEMAERLAAIQNDLFDLGADLCRPVGEDEAEAEHPPLRISSAQVERLEGEIDGMNGSVALASAESVTPEAVKYLNRLSDWFFVAARIANENGARDVLWAPGAGR